MNKLRVVLAAALPCVLLLSCTSMTMERAASTIAKPSVPKFFEAYRFILLTGIKQCGNADCEVEIDLITTTVEGKDYCLAKLPESLVFTGTHPNNSEKTITWKLTKSMLGSSPSPVEFHEQHGILMVDKGSGQFTPHKRDMNKIMFTGKNKHKAMDTATYVPVILWMKPSGPELCGTADPRIVNN